MKKTYKEIIEVIKENLELEDFANEYYDRVSLGLGEIKEVNQTGGEDEGSHWESVKYFVDHDIYISVVGCYSSYNGTDFYDGWDSCSEVRPFEIIKTIYKKI